jgi:adenosylhomocysteine nucleosidase
VGALMMATVAEINWNDPVLAVASCCASRIWVGVDAGTLRRMSKWRVWVLLAGAGIAVSVAGAAPRFDLLVQGAGDAELQPLLAVLEGRKDVQIGAWTFWTGKIGDKSIVLSRTGTGPINAAAATALAIREFEPGAIISQGSAGAHDPSLQINDIVVSETCTDFGAPEEGTVRFASDFKLIAFALRMRNPRGRVVQGNVGSASQVNRETDRLKWLRQKYGTDSEDRESAYAAGVAAAMNVPFVAIRTISESAYRRPEAETAPAQSSVEFVLAFIQQVPKRMLSAR